ncbi:peroxiredoxin [Evansella vedderi]|uniref:Peroxiredoxin n=1 Tax=Evansella vedderi TaxID=38282 RepID=A0ABT9ZPH1_9BACI|nr:peroxiredoxin [Evansella vedderi]
MKNYGVFHEKNETAIRSVFVINKEGQITYMNTSFDAKNKEHYEQVFMEINKLS